MCASSRWLAGHPFSDSQRSRQLSNATRNSYILPDHSAPQGRARGFPRASQYVQGDRAFLIGSTSWGRRCNSAVARSKREQLFWFLARPSTPGFRGDDILRLTIRWYVAQESRHCWTSTTRTRWRGRGKAFLRGTIIIVVESFGVEICRAASKERGAWRPE